MGIQINRAFLRLTGDYRSNGNQALRNIVAPASSLQCCVLAEQSPYLHTQAEALPNSLPETFSVIHNHIEGYVVVAVSLIIRLRLLRSIIIVVPPTLRNGLT